MPKAETLSVEREAARIMAEEHRAPFKRFRQAAWLPPAAYCKPRADRGEGDREEVAALNEIVAVVMRW